MWRGAEPAVPGVATSDEAREWAGVARPQCPACPDGAEGELRDDNPRLAELREAYAALDIPGDGGVALERRACRRLPRPALVPWRVADHVALPLDAGETERRYRALLEHVAARDGSGYWTGSRRTGCSGAGRFAFPGPPPRQ